MSESLLAISPVDGRYHKSTTDLRNYFSEFALIKNRLLVETLYFIELTKYLPQLHSISALALKQLLEKTEQFDLKEAKIVKGIEQDINHDVKALEYYLQDVFRALNLEAYLPFIHFGLTSQDINNTAIPLALKSALNKIFIPSLEALSKHLNLFFEKYLNIPILARTHGQAASPTSMGKEFKVFAYRLEKVLHLLKESPIPAKFGGAVGNFNAHHLAYPEIDWNHFADQFVNERLKLKRNIFTTQIDNYDGLAYIFNLFSQINTILIDLCRDIWQYIALDYFKQKVNKKEVGSSTMPHKVNPICFENAEGNLGISNAIFNHLAQKLPISRLQRDLSDSTVLRNMGVPFAHHLLAVKSIRKGLSQLVLNQKDTERDLNNNWVVLAEAVQTILRREGVPNAYELVKNFTRGNHNLHFDRTALRAFVDTLPISEPIKEDLKGLAPQNYVGVFNNRGNRL